MTDAAGPRAGRRERTADTTITLRHPTEADQPRLAGGVTDVHGRGATTITAVAWPDDPVAIAFFRSLGFEPDSGPGTQRLYGVTAFPDYDGPGEDRAVLRREVG